MKEKPRVVLPEVVVTMRDDGIIEFDYTTETVVDLEVARKAVGAARELVSGPTPSLVRINRVKEVSRDARIFFAESDENKTVSSKVALMINSPLTRIIANFFMGLNKATLPVRMFTDDQSAIEWLLSE